MFSTIFSSVLTVAHADAPAPEEQPKDQPENPNDQSDKESEGEGEGGGADAEEEEPEDVHPTLRDECSNSAQCAGFKKHFEHCQEKVEAGEGFKGEDCVEELCAYTFHTMSNRAFCLLR